MMEYIRIPEYLSGQVCSIVVFLPESPSYQPKDYAHLVQSILNTVNHALAQNCSAFLIPLCDAYNIYVARVLLHMRKRHRNIRLFVVAPVNESTTGPSLTLHIAVERIEALADHVLRLDTPIEDFPIQVAMRSDQLIVYTTKDYAPFVAFQDDVQYIDCPCSMKILLKR